MTPDQRIERHKDLKTSAKQPTKKESIHQSILDKGDDIFYLQRRLKIGLRYKKN